MQNVLKKILKHTFEMCLPNVLMMEVIRVHKGGVMSSCIEGQGILFWMDVSKCLPECRQNGILSHQRNGTQQY